MEGDERFRVDFNADGAGATEELPGQGGLPTTVSGFVGYNPLAKWTQSRKFS